MSLSKALSPNFGLVFGWGLRIASVIPIPGAVPCVEIRALPDVTVTFGRRRTVQPWPDLYQWDGVTLEFAPPGIGRFRITRESIEILPCPGVSRTEITGLLVATAFPALLWMRDRFVLHAAGVALPADSAALAITGASGSGKSTLARTFIRGGATLIGDDTLALDPSGGAVFGQGLAGGVFLGASARRRFFAMTGPRSGSGSALPLSTLCVLVPGEVMSIRPLAGTAAFEALLQNRHRPNVPAILGLQQAVMDAAATISRTLRVVEVRFDKDRQAPQELAAEITEFVSKD